MIRTEGEYNKAIERLEEERKVIEVQKNHFMELGYEGEELERLLMPFLTFTEQLKEEVTVYEQMRRGDLGALHDLNNIGRWLIGIRIAKGLTQAKLAEELGVSPAQISKDENNDYHGITVEKAQRILHCFGIQFKATIDNPIVETSYRKEENGYELA